MSNSTKHEQAEMLSVGGREVRISHPDKLYFSRQVKLSKLDIVKYYLAVAPGALQGIQDRPIVLKRFVNGAEEEAFYQKRAPGDRPEWLRTVTLSFPSGRTAEEVVVDDAAGLAWIVNLGCLELHPHPVRSGDLEHPDEMRVDLDPGPGVGWDDVRRVAMEVKALLEEVGLRGWPKTSGSRGMHINVRIHPRWGFDQVRRAALALSRAIERRVPALATSKWWKEERHGVFLDYNQNAKDRTTASAYSVRPLPDARVSAPLDWSEVESCDPADFTVFTMPGRFAAIGNRHAAMDQSAGSLDALLDMAARDEAEGPWRCAMAASLPQDGRGGAPRSSFEGQDRGEEAAPREDAAHHRGQLAKQGRGAGGAGTMEIPAPGGGPTSCRGRCACRCDAGKIHDLDPDPGQPPSCAGDRAPGAGEARSRRGAGLDRPRPQARKKIRTCPGPAFLTRLSAFAAVEEVTDRLSPRGVDLTIAFEIAGVGGAIRPLRFRFRSAARRATIRKARLVWL